MARLWRGAAALLLVAVSLVLSDPTIPTAGAATSRLRVSLLGDSVAAGIGASPAARKALGAVELSIDARVCRRTATAGCTWRGSAPPSVRDVVRSAPRQLGDVVVIVSGYNDDPRRFRADAAAVVRDLVAAGVRQVVWLDLRTTASLAPAAAARHAAVNQSLRALDRASPVLHVGSWADYSRGHDAWFFDPIHLRSAGAVELARFVASQLRGMAAGLRSPIATTRGSRCAASNGIGNRPGPLLASVSAPVPPRRTAGATRLLDTRPDGTDAIGRPVGAGREVVVPVAGRGSIPQSAVSARVRVTAVGACRAGRIEVAGCGLPATGTASFTRGDRVFVAGVVALGTFGRICVRTSAQTDVVVELLGWSVQPTAAR